MLHLGKWNVKSNELKDNEMLILQSNRRGKAFQVQINNDYFNRVGDSSVLQFLKNKGHSPGRPRSMAHSTMT